MRIRYSKHTTVSYGGSQEVGCAVPLSGGLNQLGKRRTELGCFLLCKHNNKQCCCTQQCAAFVFLFRCVWRGRRVQAATSDLRRRQKLGSRGNRHLLLLHHDYYQLLCLQVFLWRFYRRMARVEVQGGRAFFPVRYAAYSKVCWRI